MAQARTALALRSTTRVAPEAAGNDQALACWLRSPAPRWLMRTSGRTIVASGVAAQATAAGPTRFQDLRKTAQHLWADVEVEADMEVPREAGPLLVGGYAFDAGPTTPPWRLPPAWLILPREQTVWLDGKAYRTITQGTAAQPSGLVGTRERIVPDGPGDVLHEGAPANHEDPAMPAWWKSGVATVLEAIRRGEVQKVVLARTQRTQAEPTRAKRTQAERTQPQRTQPQHAQPERTNEGALSQPGRTAVDGAVARLLQQAAGDSQAEGASQFAFDIGTQAFIGSTPERLVRLHDGDVATHALAGTSEAGRPLLGRGKETREHALVGDAVRAGLERLGVRLRPAEPTHLKGAGNLQHLETPISGRAPPGLHVLDAVAALHPTPAVAGTPREGALRMIADLEPEPRGWYAGGIGCVDRFGEGEFAVAIRSALLEGTLATLYAGAGIVEGSDAAAEWRETQAKLQAMRKVLA